MSAARARAIANDGLSATVTGGHGPMATIQHAYDNICQNYDTGGQNVTIQIANGTYTTGLAISNVWIGGSQIVINGNAGSPSSVIVSTTASLFP